MDPLRLDMLRDKIKDKIYFENFLKKLEDIDKKTDEKIRSGNVNLERIIPVRTSMINSLIRRMKAKYSLGLEIKSLLSEYNKAIVLIADYWTGNNKFMGNNNEVLDQYSLGNYDSILWMLSIGYLLDVPEDRFKILVKAIDSDNIKDKLYEFIISAKIPSRPKIKDESYKYGWELYGKVRQAIEIDDKSKAAKLVKTFLEKDWYKEHKNSGWYNSHTNKHNTYSGYWSFESAAIVKIMSLDDTSFIDQQYYPKDLVHQPKEETNKKGIFKRLGL